MKLIDIANKIDKSRDNESSIDIEDFAKEFDIDLEYVESDMLKAYWVGNWYSTNTFVGYRLYFFDNEPVALSIQFARKDSETFHWFDKKKTEKVRVYLIDLMLKQIKPCYVRTIGIEEDFGDSFEIEYSAEVLDWKKGLYHEKPFTFIKRIKDNPDYGIDKKIVILYEGKEEIVNVEDIQFKFNLRGDV